MRNSRNTLTALLVGALVISACGGSDTAEPDTTDAPTTTTVTETTVPEEIPLNQGTSVPVDYAGFVAQPTACGAEPPHEVESMMFEAPEPMGIEADTTATATVTTSCGVITIALDPAAAPETVNSFAFLANQGYFDGSASHRIVPGFMMQAGDPTATGTGGPGYTFADELPPSGFVYERGTVAMGNRGPDTNGSQFFIMVADGALPPQYSVFGMVTDGLDVLDRITEVPLGVNPRNGEESVPLETVYLDSVVVDFES